MEHSEPKPQPERCPHCGSEFLETKNTSSSGDPLFTDVYCSTCGGYVRPWNSV